MRIASVKRGFALTQIKSGELIGAWVSGNTQVALASIQLK
jgi:hypothetical protein